MPKILIKRGTATQWAASTTALLPGELGLDTTNNILKVGNGISLWGTLTAINFTNELAQDAIDLALNHSDHSNIVVTYNDAQNKIVLSSGPDLVTQDDLGNSLGDYIPLSYYGNIDGVATLDSSGLIPDAQIPSTIARDSELFSGSYDDLTNKPTLFGGSYNDLTDKPTIPSLTGYATEAYVGTAISNLVDSSPETLNTLNELAAALGDDPNYATTISTALGDKVSKSGGDTITTSSASVKGLIVKGSASQTANLQEWQSSAGAVIANITPSGGLYVSSNITQSSAGRTFIGGTGDHSAFLNVSIPTASRQGVVIRANASQTANLQEWQNNSGTALASVDPNGQIRTPQLLNTASFNNSRIILSNTGTLIDSGVATNVILKVQSTNASQTADLQQWQATGGTALAKVDSTGAMFTTTAAAGTNTTQVATTAFVQTGLDLKLSLTDPSIDYYITNSGSGSYTVNGVANGPIEFIKGKKYRIHINASGHPFWIQTVSGGYSSGNVYNTGITGNGTQVGHILVELPENSPDNLYYACQFHSSMAGAVLVRTDNVSFNAQSSSYTLTTSDSGRLVEMSGGGTLTISDSSSFPVGFTCDVLQTGSSQVTIAGNGFTPNGTPGLKLRAQWSSATLLKRALNSWVVMGDLSA